MKRRQDIHQYHHDPYSFVRKKPISKWVFLLNIVLSIGYFSILTFFTPIGNPILFGLLIIGEVYHLWQAFGYIHTVWNDAYEAPFDESYVPDVDVFITVVSEPVEIVRQTVIAARDMDYEKVHVHILNDGRVAGNPEWEDYERLAAEEGVKCITRISPGGAKAGNINHALSVTQSEFVVVFDADHVPHSDFLQKTIGYFSDDKMAFVQTPQFYKNDTESYVAHGAWQQQELFFGAICRGKNSKNAAFMCGTNMVIRREALKEVGGMFEENIAEDFLTSLFIHNNGWNSYYVSEVLSEGLAPEDFLSYFKQQFRWARGSLEVIFKFNPLFMKGLSINQKLQYLISASYYLSGFVVLMNMILPVVYFYTGLVPLELSSISLVLIFMPYIFVNLYILQLTSNFSYTFQALSFSMGSFWLQIKAVFAVLFNVKTSFAVTSKQKIAGNFLGYNWLTILFLIVGLLGAVFSFREQGLTASFLTNVSWFLLYVVVFLPFLYSSSPIAAWWSHRPHRADIEEFARSHHFGSILTVGGCMALVIALSVGALSGLGLRLDESQSLWQTSHTYSRLIENVRADVHVPLYHTLLFFWRLAFGETIFVARMLSLTFFVLSIPILYLLARRLYTRKVATFSVILYSVSPLMNWFANEARMYTQLTFFTLLQQLAFVSIAQKRSQWYWLLYLVSTIAGLYTHYFFGFIVFGQILYYLIFRKDFAKYSFWKFAGVAIAGIGALAPWVLYSSGIGGESNTRPQLISPSGIDVVNTFINFLFGFQSDALTTVIGSFWPLLVVLVFVMLQKNIKTSRESLFYLVSLLAPISIAFIYSLYLSPIFLTRYFIALVPTFYILMSYFFVHHTKGYGKYLVSAYSLLVIGFFGLQFYNPNTPVREDYIEAVAYVEEAANPRDLVVVTSPFTVYPVEYYYDGPAQIVTLPEWDRTESRGIDPFSLEEAQQFFEESAGKNERIHVIMSYDQGYLEELENYLDDTYINVASVEVSVGLRVKTYILENKLANTD
jgi:cellulose synthase (UDP-forming)